MKLVTPAFPGSYVHLAEPYAMNPQDDPKYSIQIVLPKDDPFWGQVEKVQAALAEAKWGKKVPAKLRTTVNDGDATGREETAGCYYMTVACDPRKHRPEVVDRNRQPIMDNEELYSGAIYRASIFGYAWDNAFGKGISFGLNHVMKWADGDRIDGRTSADQDFADIDFADDPGEVAPDQGNGAAAGLL